MKPDVFRAGRYNGFTWQRRYSSVVVRCLVDVFVDVKCTVSPLFLFRFPRDVMLFVTLSFFCGKLRPSYVASDIWSVSKRKLPMWPSWHCHLECLRHSDKSDVLAPTLPFSPPPSLSHSFSLSLSRVVHLT